MLSSFRDVGTLKSVHSILCRHNACTRRQQLQVFASQLSQPFSSISLYPHSAVTLPSLTSLPFLSCHNPLPTSVHCLRASPFSTSKSPPSSSTPPALACTKLSRVVSPETYSILSTLAPYLWPNDIRYRLRVVGSVICLVLSKAATIQAPIILGQLVDHLSLLAGSPVSLLVLSYAIARTSASFFGELRNFLFTRVSQAACKIIACKAFVHLHSLDLDFLRSVKAGELSTIISRGVKSITQLLNMMLFQVFPTLFEFSLVLYVLFSKVGAAVAGITVATMVTYSLFTAAVTSYRTNLRKTMNDAEQRAAGLLLDSLVNAEAMRYFTAEQHEAKRYRTEQEGIEKQNVRVNESLAFLNFGQQLIFNAGLLSSLWLTVAQVCSGGAPIGHVVLVSSLLFQLAIPLNFVGSVYRETKLNLIDMHKLHDLLRLRPTCTNPINAKPLQLEGGSVRFEDIHFAFPSSTEFCAQQSEPSKYPTSASAGPSSTPFSNYQNLFKGLTIDIPAGQTVAIVGASGSGKSTLVKLLYRLFDPSHGRVLIDGQDLRSLDLHSFRSRIGVVPQDVVLYNETVMFNLKYGMEDATDEQVQEAARNAQIHDSIAAFPEQYNTVVGERGLKMSGGEKQRICIARCLLRNPAIVIFDEATSALDTHTETLILQAFRAMSVGRTCMVIAHRLSTVREADRIVYIGDGRVQEEGTHTDLINKKGGSYARLWNSQKKGQQKT
eukprot:GHVQ01028614.1.p1 GENE.GHVQ01028614.1~~GHVQ01028614.1.p1  ORF type:complete len:721 (+),score=69.79 GHVQ01028614.1:416-2578(+)